MLPGSWVAKSARRYGPVAVAESPVTFRVTVPASRSNQVRKPSPASNSSSTVMALFDNSPPTSKSGSRLPPRMIRPVAADRSIVK